ncbi:MAG TPA: lipid A biosynthesis acyltransferase [Hyphomicrobiaceae bacterium]|nr:lipid A biosynthesis acyltransferase [Hyphomicrobiaceae bacterium]
MAAVLAVLLDIRQRLLRLLVGFVRLMPLDTAVRVSARSWRRLAPLLSPKRHQRALENVAIAFPDMSEAERKRLVLAHWENLGRVMAETMQIDRLIAEPSRIEVVSPVWQRYKEKLGAVIGVSLHMGNWELAVWPLTAAGAKPAAVYRTVKNPYVDRYLRHIRRDLYPGGLLGKGKVDGSVEEGQRTARQIMDHVRHGGRLGLVCDLYDKFGIEVPFFGKPAKSVTIAGMIARRIGARIWLARCVRVGDQSRFRIEIKELKVPRTANIGDDVRTITAAMQAEFEAWIREVPEQWMWSNRRWG